jgi:hypothetical protein
MGTQPNNYAPADYMSRLISFQGQFARAFERGIEGLWLTDELIEIVTAGPDVMVARFPVPINAAGYKKHEGEIQYRRLSSKTFDMEFGVWSDGVEEKVTTLMSNQWTGWMSQPAAMARASREFEGEQAALALENGLTELSWDGVPFFSASHPINVFDASFGVQSNVMYNATPSNTTLDALEERFAAMQGPDGKELGLQLSGLLYPGALAASWQNIIGPLNGAQIVAPDGEVNPFRWRGRISGKRVRDFTLPTVYYAVATNRPDIKPLAAMRKLAPATVNMSTGMVTVGADDIETFIHDMSHPDYEKTGCVGIGKKKYFGARTAIHTAIIRCNTAASD